MKEIYVNKLCVPLFGIFCVSTSVLADVPVYRDQALSIDEALVVTDSGTSYYSDIKLSANPDGSFELVQAEQLAEAHVDEVTIHIAQSEPVTASVEISGYLPSPCYQLEEPAVMRDGTIFTIVLAQRPLQTFVACTQIIEPFTVFVPLNIKGLQTGHYTVIVNGKTSGFDLP
jgi:hypothetical protein